MGLLWPTIFLVALSFVGKVEGGQKGKMLLVEVASQESTEGADYAGDLDSPRISKRRGKWGKWSKDTNPKSGNSGYPTTLLDCWNKQGVTKKNYNNFIMPGTLYFS